MPKKLEDIKDAILRENKVKPRKGETAEQAAWAVATATYKKMKKKPTITSIVGLKQIGKKRSK